MAARRIIVVGGGVVGLCIADELLARDFEVVVVDRETKPGEGCSYGNGGIIVPSHFIPLASPGMVSLGLRMLPDRQSPFGLDGIPGPDVLAWCLRFWLAANKKHVDRCVPVLRDLNLMSRNIYQQLAQEMGVDFGFASNGILMLCKTEAGFREEKHVAVTSNSIGLKAEVLDPIQLAKFEPGIEMKVAGGIYFHDDAHITPPIFMDALHQRVIERGAQWLSGTEATSVTEDNGRITGIVCRPITGRGETEPTFDVNGDDYVLSAGVWTRALMRSLGRNLPMLAGKGYGLTVKYPPDSPVMPAFLTEARVAMTPMKDGVRFVGTMEIGKPSDHTNPDRIEGFRNSIANYYPKFTPEVLRRAAVWSGLRPCPPDGMPYLGRVRGIGNLVVATGHGMMGMSLGPVTGQITADLLTRQEPIVKIDLLNPNRYG